MKNLLYLGLALGISLVGCLVLWARSRRPRSMEHSMKEFSKELGALAPDDPPPPPSFRPRGRNPG
ncbi:MAG: hypothetical protein V7605_602 [Acidimicrobiaceae bacterium]|jgi:hypothetical protein